MQNCPIYYLGGWFTILLNNNEYWVIVFPLFWDVVQCSIVVFETHYAPWLFEIGSDYFENACGFIFVLK